MNTISKYIHAMSCEIEGCWLNILGCRGHYIFNSIHLDSSVKGFSKMPSKRIARLFEEAGLLDELLKHDPNDYKDDKNSLVRSGEINSDPLYNFNDISKFVLNYWPDRTNDSCGAHLHWSLNTHIYYSCLMEEDFYTYFKDQLLVFANQHGLIKKKSFSDRLLNTTEKAQKYCLDKFHPLKQIYVNKKIYHDDSPDRYTFLNYAFSRFNTIECRVFTGNIPPAKFLLCVKWLIETVDTYLDLNYDNYISKQHVVEGIEIEVPVRGVEGNKGDLAENIEELHNHYGYVLEIE